MKKNVALTYPYQVHRLSDIPPTTHKGDAGEALWKTLQLPGLRIREVTYSAGYIADHWCKKGHIVYVLEGDITSTLSTGESSTLTKGMMYVVSDDLSSHQSSSQNGATLLIIDGTFLQAKL